ncbi:MAG: methyltransferase domain-containing protein [Alphaproteobacteria bacterium]
MAEADNQAPFDRALLRRRRARAARGEASGADYLLARTAEDVIDRLAAINRQFPLALEIGAHDGLFRGVLRASLISAKVETLIAMESIEALARRGGLPALVADEEALPIADQSLDLVVSLLSLQWTNDLPGALIQIRRALKPDGLFLGALIGGESLTELRQAFYEAEAEVEGGVSPRVLPFVEVRTLGALLQNAGFALPVVDLDRVTVTYASPLALLKDLRAMGATNIIRLRSRRPLKRKTLFRAMEIYAQRFPAKDGRISATFEIIHASGWAPHASQQKPLAPGSAKARLADALGAVEQNAGEHASPTAHGPPPFGRG